MSAAEHEACKESYVWGSFLTLAPSEFTEVPFPQTNVGRSIRATLCPHLKRPRMHFSTECPAQRQLF